MKIIQNILCKILLIVIAFFVISCKKNKCVNISWFGITNKIESDSIINKNEKTDVLVRYNYDTSCGIFDHFSDEKISNHIKIKLFVDTEPCAGCLMMPQEKTVVYHFNQKKSGTYYLEFQNPNGTSVFDTIVVR